MTPAPSLDLSNLYRHSVFRSGSATESHTALNHAIAQHQLRWGRGEVSAALYRRDLRHISLLALRYGPEVEVNPDPFGHFALVQMPLRGSVEIECDGTALKVASGDIAIVNPRHHLRLLWQPGCEQLILKIPLSLMHANACKLCDSTTCPEHEDSTCTELKSAFKLPHSFHAPWRALVQQLIALLPNAHNQGIAPEWLEQLEKTAASFLIQHQNSANQPMLEAGADAPQIRCPSSADPLQSLESYMRSRLFAPISLTDLARAAKVSPRTLHALCHRHRGVAPMELLRNLRLDAARQRLLSEPQSSVTDVALELGFGHLGRFSSYYRSRFGELPRQTRAIC